MAMCRRRHGRGSVTSKGRAVRPPLPWHLRSLRSRRNSRTGPCPVRSWYKQFAASDAPLLALPLPPRKENDDGYDAGFDAALDNALLLLFAAAWTASEADRGHLRTAEAFAARLIEG